jgi:large subunit ribosomal protein L5
VVPALVEEFGRKNILSLPRIEKVCLNMGVGRALQDANVLEHALTNLTAIAGQRAVVTKAKQAVSNFKVRQGWKVGCRVTLRGKRMYEFLDRLMNAAMPRIRDFQGVSRKGFDGAGNYSLGVEDQSIFPEIDPDAPEANLGMDVTIVIRNSQGAAESLRLLQLMGMPFSREGGSAA